MDNENDLLMNRRTRYLYRQIASNESCGPTRDGIRSTVTGNGEERVRSLSDNGKDERLVVTMERWVGCDNRIMEAEQRASKRLGKMTSACGH